MQLRDIFVKHDQRRERWRLQPMGCVAAALAAILVASLTSGVWRILAGPRLQVTPTEQPTAILAEAPNLEPRPTATSIVREACPQDPALWTLVPYSLPGVENKMLFKVDPPCVMVQVERAFAGCVNLKADRGRHWTGEGEARCYSPAGFTTILGGEEIPALAPGWPAYGQCVETEKADGTPVTPQEAQAIISARYTVPDKVRKQRSRRARKERTEKRLEQQQLRGSRPRR